MGRPQRMQLKSAHPLAKSLNGPKAQTTWRSLNGPKAQATYGRLFQETLLTDATEAQPIS
jgi:hypothetical protein